MSFLQHKHLVKRLFALSAGALIPFAFAPFGFYLLSFLSLSILFYLWTKSDSGRESFILGYLYAFSMFGIGINWMHISINLFGGVNLIGALFFTYIFIAYISLFPAVCGYIAIRFFKHYQFIAIPALWLITEWSRGWFLTGFPWLNIGTSQIDSLLAGFAPAVGDYGITFLVSLLAMCIIFLITGCTKQRVVGGILIILITSSSLLVNKIEWSKDLNKDLDVVLIQGAIPQKLKWQPQQRQKTYDIYSGLSRPYWSSDLIIWPETAIPSLYHSAGDFIEPITEEKHKTDTLFMSGLAYKDTTNSQFFNSVLLIDEEHHFYHKRHLVPFGEFLPFKSVLGEILRFLKIPMSDFSSGKPDQKSFETKKGVFGMSICYEDAFGSIIRKSLPHANILINVSNDAWFGDSLAPHQHLQMARMRALENGRYLLRSTNTGISAIIDDKGKIVFRSPQFEPHALAAKVKSLTGETLYSKLGNSLIVVICFLLLFFCFLLNCRQKHITPEH